MVRYFRELFTYTVFNYTLNKPGNALIDLLEGFFTTGSQFFSPSCMSGEFVDYPNTFVVVKTRWPASVFSPYFNNLAILKGVITVVDDNKTKIEIAVKPGMLFTFLIIVTILSGIGELTGLLSGPGNIAHVYIGLFILIVGLPIVVGIAKGAAYSLRSAFEEELGLESARIA